MNVVKDMLKAGKTAIGATATVGSPVGLLADSGFDFLLFDTQHSPVEIKQLKPEVDAMRGKHAIPIIRVGDNVQDQVCYALDLGAKGIIVPMVNSKAEAEKMMDWVRYPPLGKRSNAGVRGEWGQYDSYREYMDAFNEQIVVIPMIETMESYNNVEDIVSVDGVDVLLFGPSDFSIALDVPLDYSNPKYKKALDHVAEACIDAGVVPGMYFIPPGHDPSDYVERGFRFFTLPWTKWATEGIQKGLSSVKR